MRHDVRRERAGLYSAPRGSFADVAVPPARYLAIDGEGDPNTAPLYQASLETLYPSAYAVRAALKARTGDDFVVAPLEGLWSADDPGAFARREKGAWSWTMLLPLPGAVAQEDVEAGLLAVKRKALPRPGAVHFLELEEGRCLQTLHLGPYDAEGPILRELHAELMPSLGVGFAGPHHEIYLSDPRRSAPEKLKTILRQPVA